MMKCENEREDSLQGWLFHLFHQCIAVNYIKFMDVGIHPRQFPFLKVISLNDGISQRDLAEAVHVKPPTVAVTVKRLEKAEMIYRRPDPDDMRVSRIYLSEKGRELSEFVDRAMDMNETILERGFSDEELAQLRAFFARMMKNMEEYTKEQNIKREDLE